MGGAAGSSSAAAAWTAKAQLSRSEWGPSKGVGEDGVGSEDAELEDESKGEGDEVVHGLLVGDLAGRVGRVEQERAGDGRSSTGEGGVEFRVTGGAVVGMGVEAVIAGVDPVSGGTVGRGEEEGVAEVLEASANGEDLIVRVGKEGEQAWARSAAGRVRQARRSAVLHGR